MNENVYVLENHYTFYIGMDIFDSPHPENASVDSYNFFRHGSWGSEIVCKVLWAYFEQDLISNRGKTSIACPLLHGMRK